MDGGLGRGLGTDCGGGGGGGAGAGACAGGSGRGLRVRPPGILGRVLSLQRRVKLEHWGCNRREGLTGARQTERRQRRELKWQEQKRRALFQMS